MVSGNMDGEVVMLSLQRGEYFGLDKIGSRIWELIEQTMKVDEVRIILMDEYDVDEETCLNDLIEFLEDLQNKGLVIVNQG